MEVPKEDLQALFDIAIGSMDFGSGFLDDEEVEVLRGFAVALGVDPIEATPDNFKYKYPHKFLPMTEEPELCRSCGYYGNTYAPAVARKSHAAYEDSQKGLSFP